MKERKKKQNSPFDQNIQQVSRFPVFSERFREDLGWWYKTDKQKAYKILDLVEAVMKDPFKGVGKPEPIKYLDTDTWSRRKENFTI
nr:Txe/YoeB family addiction module toxin [Pleurocapsa sp. PCC 7327]